MTLREPGSVEKWKNSHWNIHMTWGLENENQSLARNPHFTWNKNQILAEHLFTHLLYYIVLAHRTQCHTLRTRVVHNATHCASASYTMPHTAQARCTKFYLFILCALPRNSRALDLHDQKRTSFSHSFFMIFYLLKTFLTTFFNITLHYIVIIEMPY